MNSSIFRIAVTGALVVLSAVSAQASEKQSRFQICIERAEDLSKNIWPLANRGSALAKIALAYGRSGYFIEAERVAGEIRDEGWKISAILDIASYTEVRKQNPDIAKRLIATAKESALTLTDVSRRDSYFRQIAHQQVLNRQIDEAFKTKELIATQRDHGLRDIARAEMLNGDIDGALETADTIRPGQWKDQAFAEIAGAVARTGDLERARAIAEKMQRKPPVADPAFHAARANDEARGPEERLAFARQIPHPGQRAIALHILGNDAVRVGKRDVAKMAYREAQAAEREKTNAFPIPGIGVLHSTSIPDIGVLQARAGFIDDAIEAVKDVERVPTKQRRSKNGDSLIWLLGHIAEAQHKAGKVEEARKTVESMQRVLSEHGDHFATLELVRAATLIGNLNLARAIVETLPKPQPIDFSMPVRPNALRIIAVGLAKSGDYDGALQVVAEMDHVHTANSAFMQIAIDQVRAGRLSDALDTVARMSDAQMQAFALTEMAIAK